MTKIYYAAPLHAEADQEKNQEVVKKLRDAGFDVYSPQEHGVWENVLQRFNGDKTKTRQYLYRQDLKAMRSCNVCLAFQYREKGPSEGQLWEMGWCKGAHKTVILVNENSWGFNLMPEFGADEIFFRIDDAIDYLKQEDY